MTEEKFADEMLEDGELDNVAGGLNLSPTNPENAPELLNYDVADVRSFSTQTPNNRLPGASPRIKSTSGVPSGELKLGEIIPLENPDEKSLPLPIPEKFKKPIDPIEILSRMSK